MREFHGAAAVVVAAPPADCFALVAAVDRYPEWASEAIREADVVERDGGQPSKVRLAIHIDQGPIARDFNLFVAIATEPARSVTLTRFTDHPTNQEFIATWLVEPADRTRLALELDAKLRVPSFIPAGGIPDRIAAEFVAAASRALGA